ncbi:gamma-tubulin-complex subunit SPC97 KNAG_0E00730 [Huiozyma naganishii CBS 8797]|uniref:Spindle pole body component n=1 Tax=Huiozyma naganishii (strain ATCC MYA-139 / BCRC 22969 / CBS 8797 / KCTC 17520 / NBRC 10181 / NCYC 3082 / Yp74L-3) TaxID=1071383 RepID=J7S7H3_HUIN7|nr:hypothetical protein KNAG_0E00730 [Kazachstania naganishii CBS 8797]CCK70341.1 hypothetical protein KNAG_0E00730 [Kazachstania naganishii CBS 8797]
MEVRPVEDHVELISTNDINYGTAGERTEEHPILARCVNYEPLSNEQPKLTLYPLDQLNNLSNAADSGRLQESLVVHDLLNNLLGLSGTYIRYNNDYDPYKGGVPEFKVVKKMDASLKSISKKMLQLGSYYVALTHASEKWSDISYGIVLQRLSYEIRKFINDVYLKLIVERLEREFKENPTFSIREMKQIINDTEVGKQLSILHNLVLEIDDEMRVRSTTDLSQMSLDGLMSELNEFSQDDDLMPILIERKISPVAKGGTILKILHKMILENLGDRSSVEFMRLLLISISDNYYKVLDDWMTQGELNDPYDEFMIVNTMKNITNMNITNPTECDRIWLTQYGIRKDGLLAKFEGTNGNSLLFKILTTGKLLNLIRRTLDITKIPLGEPNGSMASPLDNFHVSNFVELLEGTNFELYVDKWYNRANKLSLKLLFNGYNLTTILLDLQSQFFGFKNGNSWNAFYDLSINDLTRQFSNSNRMFMESKLSHNFKLRKHDGGKERLVPYLMTLQMGARPFRDLITEYIKSENQTVRENNATGDGRISNFDTLRDMVMQEFEQAISSTAETNSSSTSNTPPQASIHYLKFDIPIPYPLNVVVNRSCISQYQLINRYLNLLNYHSKILDETWIEINKNKIWKYKGFSGDIQKGIIRRARIVHNSMNNFVKCISEYFYQDVIDHEMSRCYEQSSLVSVTNLQNALTESLTNILHDGCVIELIDLQLQIFDIINKFCKFVTSMRRRLCRLDYNLYKHYFGAEDEAGNGYNEEDLISKVPEYAEFVSQVDHSFRQHRDAMLEGMWHRYNGTQHPLMALRNQMAAVSDHGNRLMASCRYGGIH